MGDGQGAVVGRDQVVAVGQRRSVNGIAAHSAAAGRRRAWCAAQVVAVDQATAGAHAIGGHRVGQRRVGVTIGLALAIRCHRDRTLGDGQSAIEQIGEVVVGCAQTRAAGRDGCAARAGRCACRAAARGCAGNTRGCQHFSVDKATDRLGKARVGRAVDTRLRVGADRQVRFVDGQRAIDKAHRVVGTGETLGRSHIAAGICCTLAASRVGQRAAQDRTGLTVDKARVAHAVATQVSPAVVGLGVGVGGDGQRCLGDRARYAADAGLRGQHVVARHRDHPVVRIAAGLGTASRTGERAQRHIACGADGLVGRGDVRVAEGQAHGAGVECVGVSVDHASEAAAHRRTGGGQVAVVGLGHSGDARCGRERGGVDGGCGGTDRRGAEAVVAGIARHLVARAHARACSRDMAGEIQRGAGRGSDVTAAGMSAVKPQDHAGSVEAAAVGADKARDAATREAAARGRHGAVVGLGRCRDRRGRHRQRLGRDSHAVRDRGTRWREAVITGHTVGRAAADIERSRAGGADRGGIDHVRRVVDQ